MYGLLISIGSIAAFFISEGAAKRRKLNLSIFYKTVNYTIILGIIGARLYHVIDYWEIYRNYPLLIPQIWQGGLAIYGALIGGGLGIYCSLALSGIRKGDILKWLDVAVLGLPLAQAVGRWGNFFNRELYGIETALPWGIVMKGKKYHPLFLYESILNLILFGLLMFLERRKNPKKGTIFSLYLLGYGTIRFLLEFLRLRSWTFAGINVAQFISVLMIIVSTALLTNKRSLFC